MKRNSNRLVVPFHVPTCNSFENLHLGLDNLPENWELIGSQSLSLLQTYHENPNLFYTKSCTQSLDIALACLNLDVGSEVLIPSFGFVSLANAVFRNSLKCVFVDCDPKTMNMDPSSMEGSIGPKTKAVICINYAGVPCDYSRIQNIANNHNLIVIEDNAHGIFQQYDGKSLGNFGHIACFSFDHLKVITCFEGGAIGINSPEYLNKFLEVSELGTNRLKFHAGEVEHYEWTGFGTNTRLALPLKVVLNDQFQEKDKILSSFRKSWRLYHQLLNVDSGKDFFVLPELPHTDEYCPTMFWLKLSEPDRILSFRKYLEMKGIDARQHYSPLHQSSYGQKVGIVRHSMQFTEQESRKLIRLPLFYSITEEQIEYVCNEILSYFNTHLYDR